jgi:molybdopterin-binding protein
MVVVVIIRLYSNIGRGGAPMRLSIRNQLSGEIVAVNPGAVMATVQVRLDGGGQVITASITKEAAEELGLSVGQQATVLIKSTDVVVGV